MLPIAPVFKQPSFNTQTPPDFEALCDLLEGQNGSPWAQHRPKLVVGASQVVCEHSWKNQLIFFTRWTPIGPASTLGSGWLGSSWAGLAGPWRALGFRHATG